MSGPGPPSPKFSVNQLISCQPVDSREYWVDWYFSIDVSHNILWKDSNEIFGQVSNIYNNVSSSSESRTSLQETTVHSQPQFYAVPLKSSKVQGKKEKWDMPWRPTPLQLVRKEQCPTEGAWPGIPWGRRGCSHLEAEQGRDSLHSPPAAGPPLLAMCQVWRKS